MKHPTAKLGDVAEFIRGITFKPDDVVPLDADGAVICMRTKNVQTRLDCGDLLAVPSDFVRRKEQYLNEGDILVSSANSWNLVGKCSWVPALPWRAAFGGFISLLRGDLTRVDRRYLYWWFASERTQALLRSFGQKTTNISNLNIERCLQLDLPLPALAEQRRIAAILDKADALRTKRREALAQLDCLAQSIFVEMFGDPMTNPKGWPQVKLGELLASGPQNGLYKPASEYDSGALILRIDGFYDGVVTGLTNLKRVKVDAKELEKYGLHEGEIVINRVNSPAYLGKSALIPALTEPVVFESNMMRLALNTERVQPSYVISFLQTDFIKAQIRTASKDAVNQSSINQKDVKGFRINLPPLSLQSSFSEQLAAIALLRIQTLKASEHENSLFASLQHRAFLGEL